MTIVGETVLLWSGAGGTATTSRRRRARHRIRTLASEHPAVYLPFARRKYPGPSPKVVGPDTEVVIDGYTRSASTMAVYAFQMSQPKPVHLAHHLHAPAQLIEAARRGLPTIAVVREPRGAVLSQVVREPGVDLLDALYGYRRFHESLMPYRHAFVVADFVEVTGDFGSVVHRLNEKFGTSYGIFYGTSTEMDLCTSLIAQRPTLSPYLLGFESGEVTLAEARARLGVVSNAAGEPVWVPSRARDEAKAALHRLWDSPRLAPARSRAEDAYQAFVAS